MNFLAKIARIFSQFSSVEGFVPTKLKKIIDKYELPAVLAAYDCHNPTILYANKHHQRLMGYSVNELIGERPTKFQGKNTSEQTKKQMRDELKKSSFWHGNVINYRKDGSEVSVNLVIFAICYEGKKFYVVLKKITGE